MNLSIKNIYFTRTRTPFKDDEAANTYSYGGYSQQHRLDAVPFIVPPYFPGPMRDI